MASDPKPTSTAELVVALLQFLKELASVSMIMLLQVARSKQKQAENKLAYAEMKEKTRDDKDALASRMATKTDRDVIVDFLNEPEAPSPSPPSAGKPS